MAALDEPCKRLLEEAVEKLGLTMRAYGRTLRIARGRSFKSPTRRKRSDPRACSAMIRITRATQGTSSPDPEADSFHPETKQRSESSSTLSRRVQSARAAARSGSSIPNRSLCRFRWNQISRALPHPSSGGQIARSSHDHQQAAESAEPPLESTGCRGVSSPTQICQLHAEPAPNVQSPPP
ncbi:MAG: hypothetical protein JNJ88_05855 [Planctomycetes bacterium]|nr:hypothetical protein [Planctomycetota bacterium]